MHRLISGIDELLIGLGTAIMLSSVATLIYLVVHGWRGFINFFSTWALSCFMGVLAHWACIEYAVSGALSAIIISMTALLSHTVLGVIFHPQVQKALRQRIVLEIHTRGRAKTERKGDESC